MIQRIGTGSIRLQHFVIPRNPPLVPRLYGCTLWSWRCDVPAPIKPRGSVVSECVAQWGGKEDRYQVLGRGQAGLMPRDAGDCTVDIIRSSHRIGRTLCTLREAFQSRQASYTHLPSEFRHRAIPCSSRQSVHLSAMCHILYVQVSALLDYHTRMGVRCLSIYHTYYTTYMHTVPYWLGSFLAGYAQKRKAPQPR